MEPENNSVPVEVEVTSEEPGAKGPETPVAPEASATPEVLKEEDEKPKKSHGMLLGMIFFAVLAIGGIAFGVWEMMDGNKKAEGLNAQITALQQQIVELKKQIPVDYGEEEGEGSIVDEETERIDTEEAADATDYIYIKEWGIKIKMPESLSVINYSLSDGGTYGERLLVSGAKEKIDGITPKYANLDMWTGSILRSNSDDGFYPYGVLVYTDSAGRKYYYEGPNGIPGLSEEELELWSEVRLILKDSLKDSKNYSEI